MRRTPEAIAALVEEFEHSTTTRRDRMDRDYDMWRLLELPENAGNPSADDTGPIIGPGFRHYTSNEPRTFAEKTTSIASDAKVVVRVKGVKLEPKPKRDQQNDKERFAIGVLAAGDERLRDLIQPVLQDQLSWFAPIRGWVTVRALLRKHKDGSTFVDIQPLDPRNTSWGIGPDGVTWVCNWTIRMPREIKSIYGKVVPGPEGSEDNGVKVYDFVDAEHHQVVTENKVLEKATRHGSPRVPVWIGVVGAAPRISGHLIGGTTNGSSGDGTSADYGESIYAANRLIYAQFNFMMSVVLELMSRARSPGVKVFSREGNKSLEEDPFKAGSELSLKMEAEDVKPLEQIETTRDAVAFAAFVQGEMQRGSLPHSVFGELAFQLSGFAINSLRQGVASIINPTIKAIAAAILGIVNLLVDQYVTGQFKAMEVAGIGRNRQYFSVEITPDQVKEAEGRIVVEVLPELPQDEPAKMQMAHLARTPGPDGKPLLGNRTILEDILNRQDPDADAAVVLEQLADAASPLAQAVTTLQVATELEREDLIFAAQAQVLVVMRDMLAATGQQPPGAPGSAPGAPGIPPSVAPQQALGQPQPAPTPQQGPLVPQGQPRPGARNDGATLDEMLLG